MLGILKNICAQWASLAQLTIATLVLLFATAISAHAGPTSSNSLPDSDDSAFVPATSAELFFVVVRNAGHSAWANLYAFAGGDPVNREDPTGLDYIEHTGDKYYWVVEQKGTFYDSDVQRIEIGEADAFGDLYVKSMGFVTDESKLNNFAKQFYIGDESADPAKQRAMVEALLGEVKMNPQVMPQYSSLRTRLNGIAQAAGGAAESAGGAALIATPEPTMLTKVGGGILLVHGADNFAAGTISAIRGTPTLTLNEFAVSHGLQGLGVSEGTANRTAGFTNAAIGIAGGITAARGMIPTGPAMLPPRTWDVPPPKVTPDRYPNAPLVQHQLKASSAAQTINGDKVVLGHYPEYVPLAEQLHAKNFVLKNWEAMTPDQIWAANVKFLERTVQQRVPVVLATPINIIRSGSYLEKELMFLKGKGYYLDPTETQLLPPRMP